MMATSRASHHRRARGRPSALLALAASVPLAPAAMAQCPPGAGAWVPGIGDPGVSGIAPVVASLLTLPSGEVIVGGVFESAGGVPVRNIARYSPAANTWSALGTGGAAGAGPDGGVAALAVLPGGDILAGGSFSSVGGVVVTENLARYTPGSNAWFAVSSDLGNNVYALAVMPGGDVVVGGNFTSAGGVTANHIARYSPASGTWSPLGAGGGGGGGVSGEVWSLAVLPAGGPSGFDIYAGGAFSQAFSAGGGVAGTAFIARYNTASGAWSALGSGVSGQVRALTPHPSGDLMVGGQFVIAGGVFSVGIARFAPASGSWSGLGTGVSPGYSTSISALAGGEVVAGGGFNTAGGGPGNYIARYSWAGTAWSPLGPGLSHAVLALTRLPAAPGQTDGDLIVGGVFTSADGAPAGRIARYNLGSSGAPACYANCDCSTTAPVLNVADFGCFLTRYAAGEAYANCDDSTTPPVLNVADFGCFLTRYAAGCP